jgi:serine protease AprX
MIAAILCAPLALNAPTFPAAANLRQAAPDKLRGGLAERAAAAGPRELLPIQIVLSAQVPEQVIAAAAQSGDKPTRRAAVVALLREAAESTQTGLVEYLSARQAEGAVGPFVRRLWIANVIGAEVAPAVALELAQRADVAYLHLDLPRGEEVLLAVPTSAGGPDAPTCGLTQIGATQVWSQTGITGRGVVVGVIDTGICATHTDISGQRWCNPDELPGNGIDDDGNGYIDDLFGWNFESNNNNTTDTNGHGSHTSGTVAGDGTQGTQCGVAPDARVMALKFWNSFSGEQSVWDSMQYGVANGADVLTASLGWPHFVNPNRPVWRQVCENAIAAGVVVIYAAGNEGCGSPPDNVRTPGDVPAVITVGAVDCNDFLASFSSCGPITWQGIPPYDDFPYPPGLVKPDICAAGVNVTSHQTCSGYVGNSGTSMATPHIAGVAALLLEANPALDQAGVKALLESTALDLGPAGKDNQYGAGRARAFDAVQAALGSGQYCAPKPNSCGTLPMITISGSLSASATSGCLVSAGNAPGLAFGLLVYTNQGPANAPFLGGSLCINGPERTVAVIDTTGTQGQCNGTLRIDMNQFRAGLLGGTPQSYLSIPGTSIHLQYWIRDAANSFGAGLSQAFKTAVCP